MARFSQLALSIEIDDEYWDPHSLVLRAPQKIEPKKSRVIFHEAVHFWQQCSQTFLAQIADENWSRLKTYEETGEIRPPGPSTIEYTCHIQGHGFSARDLQEGLARFWDVHVISPITLMDIEIEDSKRCIPKPAANEYRRIKRIASAIDPSGYPAAIYDLAMDFTAGNYAKPYIDLRERTSSYIATALFPLAGHFALQSDRPVPFFMDLVERAIPHIDEKPGARVTDVWPLLYHRVRNLAVQLHKEQADRPFYPAAVVMANSSLKDHPVYLYVVGLIHHLAREIVNTPAHVVPGYDNAPIVQRGTLSVDFFTACPGILKFNRTFLVSHLAPPCIRFADGRAWILRLEHLKESYPDMKREEELSIEGELRKLVEHMEEIEERWRRFRLASLRINV